MRRFALAPVVAVVLAVLLLFGGYMGAYYAMLNQQQLSYWEAWAFVNGEPIRPRYRINTEGMHVFLVPAHEIDRRIRPAYWTDVDKLLNPS